MCLRPFTHYTVPHPRDDRCFGRNRSCDANVIMQSRACVPRKATIHIINCTWRTQIRGQVRRLSKVSRYSMPSSTNPRISFFLLDVVTEYIIDYVKLRGERPTNESLKNIAMRRKIARNRPRSIMGIPHCYIRIEIKLVFHGRKATRLASLYEGEPLNFCQD